jgi:hypothetical protein
MQRMFFIADLIACSACFSHHYAHHQELESIIQMVAACGIWCYKDGKYNFVDSADFMFLALFPHINDDAWSKSLQMFNVQLVIKTRTIKMTGKN